VISQPSVCGICQIAGAVVPSTNASSSPTFPVLSPDDAGASASSVVLGSVEGAVDDEGAPVEEVVGDPFSSLSAVSSAPRCTPMMTAKAIRRSAPAPRTIHAHRGNPDAGGTGGAVGTGGGGGVADPGPTVGSGVEVSSEPLWSVICVPPSVYSAQ
jgi:hypothetical protein